MALGHRVLVLLVVCCIAVTECSKEDSDHQELEYVFSIPTLLRSIPPHVVITTTSEDPVVATLSIPGYVLPIIRTITRTNDADIELPADIRMKIGDGKQNKTVIVRASSVISVYAIANDDDNGDVFQCIPSVHLGTKYSVASYKPWSTIYSSFVCVSAIHSYTTVTISNATDIIYSIMLQKYESFRYDGDGYEDLSGLFIHGTKAIAVIAGSTPYIPANQCCPSGIVSQLSPFNSWGIRYNLLPFQSLNIGFVYRVFSYNVSSTLHMYDGRVEEIQPGEFYEGDVSGDTVVSFEADQPVMVAQYMKGGYANNPKRGAPSMLIVKPVSSYTNNVRFPVFDYTHSSGRTYYINVVTQCDNIDGLLYDEAISVTSWDKLTTDDQSVCCVRSNVSTGYHSVTHANPNATFFVSFYAIGVGSSYAYVATGIFELVQDLKPILTTDTPTQTKQSTLSGMQPTSSLTSDIISGQGDVRRLKAPPSSEDANRSCKKNSGCPQFTTLENGFLQPNKTVYDIGQIVTVYCRRGFDLIGDESLVCAGTGEWHGQIPLCIQRNTETSGSVVIISASVGGVVLIALVLIPIVCYCQKWCKSSGDNSHYDSSNLPRPHATPVHKESSEIETPNTDARDADNEGYEIPRDKSAYHDLQLSTITSSEQDYHGLYAQAT